MSFRDNHTLLQKIDNLPSGPQFRCMEVRADGDQEDSDGKSFELLELWMRDPVECVKELMGNPAFKDDMAYRPVRKWRESGSQERRVYDEAWTADWWWQTQVCLSCLLI